MLKTWCKILPFFIVEYIAKKHLERYQIIEGSLGRPEDFRVVAYPFHGVYIEVNRHQRLIDAEIDRLHK